MNGVTRKYITRQEYVIETNPKRFCIFLLVKGDPSNVNKTINLKYENYFENNVKFYFDMFKVIRNIQE